MERMRRASKPWSKLLRHKAAKYGTIVREDGVVAVDDVVVALRMNHGVEEVLNTIDWRRHSEDV